MDEKQQLSSKEVCLEETPQLKESDSVDVKQAAMLFQEAAQQLTSTMEHMRIAEYVRYLNHPRKLLWTNFLIGLARGLGSTIGLALVLTGLFFVLQEIITMNLPFMSEWIGRLIYSIEENLQFFTN